MPIAASSAGRASPSARRTPSGSTRTPTCPSWSRCAPGARLCWDFCPRGGLRYEALWPPSTTRSGEEAEVLPAQVRSDSSDTYWKITGGPPADGLGAVVESFAVRASSTLDDVQDGGAVSALLIGLLAAGEIDGALVSKPSGDPDEQWKGVATIATTAERDPGRLGQLLQPDHGPGRARPLPLHAAGQAAHRRGRARPARCRGSGPCRRAAGRPGPIASMPSC